MPAKATIVIENPEQFTAEQIDAALDYFNATQEFGGAIRLYQESGDAHMRFATLTVTYGEQTTNRIHFDLFGQRV